MLNWSRPSGPQRGGSAQHRHIWKPLLPPERMGSGGESGAGWRAGIIPTADQTTISSCLQLASLRRWGEVGAGGHRGKHLTGGWPPARLIIPRTLLAWPPAKAGGFLTNDEFEKKLNVSLLALMSARRSVIAPDTFG